MDLRIAGKRALVTGSTLGIGRAIAEALAVEGAHVIVNGRNAARVDNAVREIARYGSATGCAGRLAWMRCGSGSRRSRLRGLRIHERHRQNLQ